jgi:Tfp pilus assembly protein PilO
MSVSDRDKKIVMAIVPIVLLLGYWFLVLAPQRNEASKAANDLAKQEKRRDQAQQKLQSLNQAKSSFADDYAQLVKLGKAVPTTVDMPSLIVQLDSAARGTDIEFTKIAAGQPIESAAPPQQQGSGGQAQSGPGKTAQSAKNGVNNANSSTQAGEQAAQKSGAAAGDAKTSTSSGRGLPVGGGQAGGGGGDAAAGCAAGLDCVPLEFEFKGGFFDLAGFFHRLKRFVKAANERLVVRGRLLTIDSLKFSSDADSFPALKAEVKATVYLSPNEEGATAGATPDGPSQTTPAGSGQSPPASPTPAATATP